MIPFIDNDEYKMYERETLSKRGKKLLFLKKYAENGVSKWMYIVEKFQGKEYIRYWNQELPDINEYFKKEEPKKEVIPIRDEKKKAKRELWVRQRRAEQHYAIEKNKEDWKKSPLSIKLYGNKEKYNPNFTDEENAAMFYCSEWLRKCITYKGESIFTTCQRLYDIDINKIRNRMNESSVNKTNGSKYTWYIIQPYIYEKENKIYHYLPKTMIRALTSDNVERRLSITPELHQYYTHITNANILYSGNSLKEIRKVFNDIKEEKIDKEFIEKMKFKFIKGNDSIYKYDFDEKNGYYNLNEIFISDEQYIQNIINERIKWLKENHLYIENTSEERLRNHFEEQISKKYNIEMYLKNFAKCYDNFLLFDEINHNVKGCDIIKITNKN